MLIEFLSTVLALLVFLSTILALLVFLSVTPVLVCRFCVAWTLPGGEALLLLLGRS